MRKKQVEFDGEKFLISPLTLDQTDEYFKMRAPPGDSDEVRIEKGKNRQAFLICTALNNANPDAKWTPERCNKELDSDLFWNLLPTEILRFMGLKPVAESRDADEKSSTGPPQGESPAVSVN
jgi:hypothetical protein